MVLKENKIKVKLVQGYIGLTEKQRSIVRGLGLRKRESVSVLENTPAVRGMIKKVIHLLKVEE